MTTFFPLQAKTVPLHLLVLDSFPILQQLKLEEALLRIDTRNWCLINRGSSPAIVMGISGKPELLLNQQKLAQAPVPVIRRFSGGGTVFVDEHTFFVSWICNSDHTGVAGNPDKLHRWSEQFYQSAWPSLAMKLRENDYVAGDRKFGGNAQYLCKQRWLHHSSLLWDFNGENMDYLLMPPQMPTYRQQRDHDAFLCRLGDLFASKDELENQLFHAIYQQFHVVEMVLEEIVAIIQQPHRQATQELNFFLRTGP
jgi:lipoate-protein ligase A